MITNGLLYVRLQEKTFLNISEEEERLKEVEENGGRSLGMRGREKKAGYTYSG